MIEPSLLVDTSLIVNLAFKVLQQNTFQAQKTNRTDWLLLPICDDFTYNRAVLYPALVLTSISPDLFDLVLQDKIEPEKQLLIIIVFLIGPMT